MMMMMNILLPYHRGREYILGRLQRSL